MALPPEAEVTEVWRKPPIWSVVKAQRRSLARFFGGNARERAIDFAAHHFETFIVIELPPRRWWRLWQRLRRAISRSSGR